MSRNILGRWAVLSLCFILIFTQIPAAGASVTAVDFDGAHEAILQAYDDLLYTQEDFITIDVSAFSLTPDQLADLVVRTGYLGEQPWYLESFSHKYNTTTGLATSVTFNRLSSSEYDYELYARTAAQILDATVVDGMADWQIALSIHDYLAANCAYDESLTYRSAYDALVRGTTVCKGYANAYQYLLQRCGIPCGLARSDGMDHVWNVVQIQGEWYHVDVTWDDPVSNHEGRVSHKYFLLSDKAIADEDHGHYGWETDVECTDTTMDTDRFWQEITSQICYVSRDLCYFREKTDKTVYTIYSRNADGDEEKIVSFDAGYIKIAGSHENGTHYSHDGLTLWNGKLYYSDMKKVYSVNPDGSGKTTVYSHDCEALDTFIAGSHVADGILYLTLSDSSRKNLTTMQIDLGVDSHTHAYTGEVVTATCQSNGYTHYSCQCGITYEANWLPAAEHSYDEGTVIREATTQQAGIKRYSCTACGESYDEEIPILSDTDNGSKNAVEADPPHIALIAGGVIVLLILIFRKRK